MAPAPALVGRARRIGLWQVARPVLTLGTGALAVVVLLGRKGELAGAGTALGHIEPLWLIPAVAAELASMTCFALATGRLAAEAGNPLRLRALLGIALAGNAITNSLPAGPAFGAAYAFRRYRERGMSEVASGWVILAVGVLASASLALLAAVGVAAALGQGTALDLVGAVVGTLAVTAALLAVLRRPQVVTPAALPVLRRLRRLTGRPRLEPERVVAAWRARLEAVTPSWPGLWAALGWALANWVLDLACLLCAFGAVDAAVPWRALLLAYGAAQLAANLPVTPGGLGVVEGSLTIGLVAYGGSQAGSVAAVLLYRMVSFWGLLVAGWVVAGGLAVVARRLAAATSDPAVPAPAGEEEPALMPRRADGGPAVGL